jgi:hypothetical protein
MVSVSSPCYSRPDDAVCGYAKITLVGAVATGSPCDAQLSLGDIIECLAAEGAQPLLSARDLITRNGVLLTCNVL